MTFLLTFKIKQQIKAGQKSGTQQHQAQTNAIWRGEI